MLCNLALKSSFFFANYGIFHKTVKCPACRQLSGLYLKIKIHKKSHHHIYFRLLLYLQIQKKAENSYFKFSNDLLYLKNPNCNLVVNCGRIFGKTIPSFP